MRSYRCDRGLTPQFWILWRRSGDRRPGTRGEGGGPGWLLSLDWTPGIDPLVDLWVALAAIVLGSLVTPLPRRPWMVGRQNVSLDHLSAPHFSFGESAFSLLRR